MQQTDPAERSCYCGLWLTRPEFFEKQGIPRGFCGLCQICGKPGHTRHFPGAVPYTGSWCDHHYQVVKLIHPLGVFGFFIWIGVIFAALLWWLL